MTSLSQRRLLGLMLASLCEAESKTKTFLESMAIILGNVAKKLQVKCPCTAVCSSLIDLAGFVSTSMTTGNWS